MEGEGKSGVGAAAATKDKPTAAEGPKNEAKGDNNEQSVIARAKERARALGASLRARFSKNPDAGLKSLASDKAITDVPTTQQTESPAFDEYRSRLQEIKQPRFTRLPGGTARQLAYEQQKDALRTEVIQKYQSSGSGEQISSDVSRRPPERKVPGIGVQPKLDALPPLQEATGEGVIVEAEQIAGVSAEQKTAGTSLPRGEEEVSTLAIKQPAVETHTPMTQQPDNDLYKDMQQKTDTEVRLEAEFGNPTAKRVLADRAAGKIRPASVDPSDVARQKAFDEVTEVQRNLLNGMSDEQLQKRMMTGDVLGRNEARRILAERQQGSDARQTSQTTTLESPIPDTADELLTELKKTTPPKEMTPEERAAEREKLRGDDARVADLEYRFLNSEHFGETTTTITDDEVAELKGYTNARIGDMREAIRNKDWSKVSSELDALTPPEDAVLTSVSSENVHGSNKTPSEAVGQPVAENSPPASGSSGASESFLNENQLRAAREAHQRINVGTGRQEAHDQQPETPGEQQQEQSFDKILARDIASEQGSPELVKGIPQYTLESLLETLPDAVASGKVVVDRLGAGMDGIVFRLSDQKDHAIKLYHNSLPDSVMEQIYNVVPMSDEDKAEVVSNRYMFPPEQVSTEVLCAAGAEVLGHKIAPEYVDPPDNIFTYNGLPIGFSSRAVAAEPVRVEEVSDPNIKQVIQSLKEAGVYVDYHGQNVIPYVDDSGNQRVKIIDMEVDEATLHQKVT